MLLKVNPIVSKSIAVTQVKRHSKEIAAVFRPADGQAVKECNMERPGCGQFYLTTSNRIKCM